VGTLSPTPHHPKVVAMLRVPFPLPDVEVERMEMRKRALGESHSFIWGRDVDVCADALGMIAPISF
jgi:hypothetical protein